MASSCSSPEVDTRNRSLGLVRRVRVSITPFDFPFVHTRRVSAVWDFTALDIKLIEITDICEPAH